MPKQFLIYDANCPMCRSFVARLGWLGLTKRSDGIEPVPNTDYDFGEALNARVAEKLGYEMQLVEPESEKIFSGIDVMLEVLSKIAWLSWLPPILRLPGIYRLVRFAYRIVAYNRKILTPPDPRRIACACDPPELDPARRGVDVYRVSLWIILAIVIVADLLILDFIVDYTLVAFVFLPALGLYCLINALFSLLEYRYGKTIATLEQNLIPVAFHTTWFTLFIYGALQLLHLVAGAKLSADFFELLILSLGFLMLLGFIAYFVFMLLSAYRRRYAIGIAAKRNGLEVGMSVLFILLSPLLGAFLYVLRYYGEFNL